MLVARCRQCASKILLKPLQKDLFLCSKLLSSTTMSTNRNLANEVDGDDCMKDYNYVFKPDLLKNKVAFITGGGSGIGFRITEVLMRHGCKTAIASRKLEKVEKAAKKLREATNGECLPLQVDVREPMQIQKVVDEILSEYGKLDILVNNAAGNFLSSAENLSFNAFKTVMEIDTMGTFNVTKVAFEKYFNAHGGNIVNISATLAYRGDSYQTHAGSAKAAIDAMTKHLAVEWGRKGIRVNCIAPGPIDGTEGFRKLGGKSKAAEALKRIIPLQRFGSKTEIADSALYLASDASSFVTGTVLVVDGGNWLAAPNDPAMFQLLFKSDM